MSKRELSLTVLEDERTNRIYFGEEEAVAGYAGEHLATKLEIALPLDWEKDEEASYQLYFLTADNTPYNSVALKPPISYELPSALMAAGYLYLQLVMLCADGSTKKSEMARLTVKPSIKNADTVADTGALESAEAAAARLKQVIDKAELISSELYAEITATQYKSSFAIDANGVPIAMSANQILSPGNPADFTSDERIVSVYISPEVTEIQSGAFSGCSNLTDVYIDNNREAVNIWSGAFKTTPSIHYKDDERYPAYKYLLSAMHGIYSQAESALEIATGAGHIVNMSCSSNVTTKNQLVKLAGNNTVGLCSAGDIPIGITAVYPKNGAADIKLSGSISVPHDGTVTAGYRKISAADGKTVRLDENGVEKLVLSANGSTATVIF